ncbi:MAG TPA: DNA cytosine methyltransferase, partial [Tepidiformaceae bacterium]|nr:DNA cytosine methyltransferase [Tepidiformaceae bacterium]
MKYTVLEICTGGGGQALGLEMAGFDLAAAVEIDRDSCVTLRANRPGWQVIEDDVANIDGRAFRGVELFAGGVPCPPFSIAGKQLGREDERDLFPQALASLRSPARPRCSSRTCGVSRASGSPAAGEVLGHGGAVVLRLLEERPHE